MGIFGFLYSNSIGFLLRGCRSPSTETAIDMEGIVEPGEAEQLDPGEFPAVGSEENFIFLPEKVLEKIVSKLDVDSFLSLSETCRLLNKRLYEHCRLRQRMLLMYVRMTVDGVQVTYNQQDEHDRRKWIPKEAIVHTPLYYDELHIVFDSPTGEELYAAVECYEKIRHRVGKVGVMTNSNVHLWSALPEFDDFLKVCPLFFLNNLLFPVVNCAVYTVQEPYLLPLKMAFLAYLSKTSLVGQFDYSSNDVSHFAHYNPCLNVANTPVQVVINAIKYYNRGCFAMSHQTYRYREKAPEILLFEQWLFQNGTDVYKEDDGDGFLHGTLLGHQNVVVRCSQTEIHLMADPTEVQ